jgi:hypothetical protein
VARALLLALLAATFAQSQAPRIRHEEGRFWVHCQSAPLEEILREIADLSPMELWLEEGLSAKRVTAKIERATLKQALEEIFDNAPGVNYVLSFDRANPERVTKIYAGSGGDGRLAREPSSPPRTQK